MLNKHSVVSWEKKDSIGIITLNNPPLNVLDVNLKSQLSVVLEEIENSLEVTVVIIHGGNKSFMAGADIKNFNSLMSNAERAYISSRENHRIFNQVENLTKPVIAALTGFALGGGCELALACDFRIAEKSLKIGLPEIKLGLFPGAGGTQRLPRIIGKSKAKEFMMLGDHLDADAAYKIGLVDKVVPDGEALQAALKFANKLASRPGVALKMIKALVNKGMETDQEQGMFLESVLIEQVFKTEDVREGVDAFLKKRKPYFKNK